MAWQNLDDGGIWCPDHRQAFSTTTNCTGCVPLVGQPTATSTDDDATPEGCIDLATAERRLVKIADTAEDGAKAFSAKDATWRERNAAVKLLDVAVRAIKAAAELANTRERRAHIKRLAKGFHAGKSSRRK